MINSKDKSGIIFLDGQFVYARLRTLFISLQICLLFSLLNTLVNSGPSLTALWLGLAILFNIVPKYLYKKHYVLEAKITFLSNYTVLLTILVLQNGGMYDSAAYAFISIIVIAAILVQGRYFIIFVFTILTLVSLISSAEITGFLHYPNRSLGWEQMLDYIAIISATSFCLWLISNDLKNAIARLKQENLRVKSSQSEIERMATFDELTGIYNRRAAPKKFAAIMASKTVQQEIIVLYIDCDNFKEINDTYGHHSGDIILKNLAQRLSAKTNQLGFVSRLGGDEFLLVQALKSADAKQFADEVLYEFKKPIITHDLNYQYSVSIGAAVTPLHGNTLDELNICADLAMYHAKKLGKNNLYFYNKNILHESQKQLRIINALRYALDNDEIEIYYQPKIDIISNKVIGAEALLRWRNPDFSDVSTQDIINAAERSGQIIDIGKHVLLTSCIDCKEWQNKGFNNIPVSVNVCCTQLMRGDLHHIITEILEISGLNATSLDLEITESQLVDQSSDVSHSIEKISAMGITLSIDDFGTGYSNFDYLRVFNAHNLKIDISFLRNIMHSQRDQAIVKAIIQIAKSLSMKTIAEGVEYEECLALLKAMGCDYSQGFLHSKALPQQDFLAFLHTYNNRATVLRNDIL